MAENAVTWSTPVAMSASISAVNTPTYTAKKPQTASTTRSGTARPPSCTGISAVGCTSLTISRRPCFTSSRQRTTLRPPAVEPAQPPMNDANSSSTGNPPGQ